MRAPPRVNATRSTASGWPARLHTALMPDYNRKATVYWWCMVLMGAAALAWALLAVWASPDPLMVWQVAAGCTVAMLAGVFPVRIPGSTNSFAAGEIFIFLLLLMFGPAAAAIAAAGEAFVGSMRTSKRWTSRLASPAMAALSMCAVGWTLHAAMQALRNQGAYNDMMFVMSTVLLSMGGFMLNTLFVTLVFNLKRNEPLRWHEFFGSFGWVGITYAASALMAALLYLGFRKFGIGVVMAAVPLIAMLLTMLHYHFRQRETDESAQQVRIAAAEREASQAARHVVELQTSERRFHSAFSHAAIGMVLVSTEGVVLQANAALCGLLGRSEAELAGSAFVKLVHGNDIGVLQQLMARGDHDLEGQAAELRCRHALGHEVWVSMHCGMFSERGSSAPCLILQAQDITARRDAESRLHHIAYHDSLTSLANRMRFGQCLAQAVARCKEDPKHNFALMYLDFDRFKLINDTLGHAVGDEFLVAVAHRIQAQVRPADTVGRLGGDEFGILIEDLEGEHYAITMAERLQRTLCKPYSVAGTEVNSSASIGITFSSIGYDTPGDVLRDADIAMYRAKASGRARYAVFDASLRAQIADQLHLEGDLRRAIDGDQLFLAYQPIYDLVSGRINSFEALLRWNHPERGLIGPDVFIPIAEESGLIGDLTEQVLMRACRQLRHWQLRDPARPKLRMQVNVSGTDLCRLTLVSHVTRALVTNGLEPWQLTLEITESMLMKRLDSALETMMQLRELGVGLSVDDFGTGYSSLSYLSTLPITSLKIDRSFVQRLQDGVKNTEVVKAIVTLGHSLGRAVIAEGIESPAQLAKLRELDCGFGQGYLLARPLTPEMAATWLEAEAAASEAPAIDSPSRFDPTGFGHMTMH